MLNEAVLLLLFAVSGSPTGDVSLTTPAALAATSVPLRARLTLGQWRGDLVAAGGARQALEVSVSEGLKRDTVFGYFTVTSQGSETTTLRRLGQVTGDDLVFALRESGRLALRLRSGRLVGDLIDPAGQLTGGQSTVELLRTRP